MMPADTIGRELIELVQIDQDFCNNTYGVAPCTARLGYQFDFNGDGYIETQRRWNPDAVDTSFVFEFRNNLLSNGTIISQANTNTQSDREFQIYIQNSDININMGGTVTVLDVSASLGDGLWRVEYDGSSTAYAYKDGNLIDSSSASIGVARDPLQNINIGARGDGTGGKGYLITGVLSDLKLYLNTQTTNDLVLDMPINDNRNTIKDYANVDDGVLTAGTGSWILPNGGVAEKCFNTYATCQDQPNYDKGTKQITFKKNQSGDVDEYTIPILNGFSVTLPELNIFSRDTKNQALGKFGKCSVTFSDTIFSDNHLDPYVSERRYNPLEQGTFWTKFLARNPYYEGWKIRLYDGLVGQTLAEMNVREYELEKITNPDSNGKVNIKATDLMRRLDKSKAIYPPASNCLLRTAYTAGDSIVRTEGKLTDYDDTEAERCIRIGNEIAVIEDVTEIASGLYNYELRSSFEFSQNYEVGDSAENATILVKSLYKIIDTLLSPIYSDYELNLDMLQNEIDDYMPLFAEPRAGSRLIQGPTPVSNLISELKAETGLYFWYNTEERRLNYKSARGEPDPVIELNQNINLISGKTVSKVISESRISRVYMRYNAYFFVQPNEDFEYKKHLLNIDIDSEDENEYGSFSFYQYDRLWYSLDDQVVDISTKLLDMYKVPPREITFELDIKDDIRMAQVFKLAWRGYTDIYGNDEVINWICTGRTRTRDRLKITAQEFKFNVPEA